MEQNNAIKIIIIRFKIYKLLVKITIWLVKEEEYLH